MKKNNKGFSLVELIIVIAIMAILAGAIAPALIRYIDKSRKSNDVSAAKSIKTAVETALASEKAYEELTAVTPANYIKITANQTAATAITGASFSGVTGVLSGTTARDSIFASLSNKTPKFNYKKAADSSKGKPDYWLVEVNGNDVRVGIKGDVGTNNVYWLSPEVDDDYQ